MSLQSGHAVEGTYRITSWWRQYPHGYHPMSCTSTGRYCKGLLLNVMLVLKMCGAGVAASPAPPRNKTRGTGQIACSGVQKD